MSINIEGRSISQVKSAKTLGLYVQENLYWSKNTDHVYKKASSGLGLLMRVRDLMDTEALTNIYQETLYQSCLICIMPALYGMD